MAYTKQTWNTGDTITADKLNHIEDGISDAGTINERFYAVPGDYDHDDTLPVDEYNKIRDIMDENNGVVMINTTTHHIFFGSLTSVFHNYNGDTLEIDGTGHITITLNN